MFGAIPASVLASLGVYHAFLAGHTTTDLPIIVAIILLAALAWILNYRLYSSVYFDGEVVLVNGDHPLLGGLIVLIVFAMSALLTFLTFVWIVNQNPSTSTQSILLVAMLITALVVGVAIFRFLFVFLTMVLAALILSVSRHILYRVATVR